MNFPFHENKIPVGKKPGPYQPIKQKYSARLTGSSRYMDILNGMLMFGEEKFTPTARPVREGYVLTPEDMKKEEQTLSSAVPYSVCENRGLDPGKNSISLVNGVSLTLPSGFRLDITAAGMEQSGDIRRMEEREEAARIAEAMNSVIKIANGQVMGYHFYREGKQNTRYALAGLAAAGIDTERDFSVNGTRFIVTDGILLRE